MRTLVLTLSALLIHVGLSAQLQTRVALTAPNAVELGLEYTQVSKVLHLAYGASVLNGSRDWATTGYVNVGYVAGPPSQSGTQALIGTRLGYQIHPTRDLADAFLLSPYVAIKGRKRTVEAFFRFAYRNGRAQFRSSNAAEFGGGLAILF
jgi:hypothetical protein